MTPTADVSPSFWAGRRVLVTGHTGFKGAWLSIWLKTLEAQVRGIALSPPSEPALFNEAQVARHIDHQVTDIRNEQEVQRLLIEYQPEIVFHLAAQPLVRHSYTDPMYTYSTNVMGTVNILEAAKQSGSVRVVVNVTSDKCYAPSVGGGAYKEDDRLGGHDPYSSSKACAEIISAAYRESFFRDLGIALATARAGNVIGGGDWAKDRLVPDILRSLAADDQILIRYPNAVRPWQHVLEPLCGYLILAEQLYQYGQRESEAWNFGPSEADAQPVHWLVDELTRNWGSNRRWMIQPGNHPRETQTLTIDSSKSISRLRWTPRWSLATALKHVVDWHRSWVYGADAFDICVDQIRDYQSNKLAK